MKRQDIEWQRLLPIENPRNLSLGQLPYTRSMLKKISHLPPITAIPLEDSFIVPDGHHRTLSHLISGKIFVPAIIIEHDMELKEYTRGTAKPYGSLDFFRQEYLQTIKPELEACGILNFADYPLLKEMVRRGITA